MGRRNSAVMFGAGTRSIFLFNFFIDIVNNFRLYLNAISKFMLLWGRSPVVIKGENNMLFAYVPVRALSKAAKCWHIFWSCFCFVRCFVVYLPSMTNRKRFAINESATKQSQKPLTHIFQTIFIFPVELRTRVLSYDWSSHFPNKFKVTLNLFSEFRITHHIKNHKSSYTSWKIILRNLKIEINNGAFHSWK